MTPDRWKQVKEIFNAALGRSFGVRETFLDEACGGDLLLRRQFEHFIGCYVQAGDFIETLDTHDPLLPDDVITMRFDATEMVGENIALRQ